MGTRSAPCTRHRREVLSQEEVALLHVLRSSGGRAIDATEAAQRTGMSRGLAALGLELLESRGLTG
ncbi:MAG: hypothetical protein H0W70_04710 [Actinobacteria bacterium]|nr:hypothetical protein [Actinomycetota bacterium]